LFKPFSQPPIILKSAGLRQALEAVLVPLPVLRGCLAPLWGREVYTK
jgi:hypothetical protein